VKIGVSSRVIGLALGHKEIIINFAI